MEKDYLVENNDIVHEMHQKAERKASEDGELCQTLCHFVFHYYNEEAFQQLWKKLTKLYGKSPRELDTIEEFLHPELKEAITTLVGEKGLKDIEEIIEMRLDGQFSTSMCRRCYRSKKVKYHASELVYGLSAWIHWSVYDKTVAEALCYEVDYRVRGYSRFLALEIKRENPKVIELVKEAMLGDNQTVTLSTNIIRAIIISGNDEMLEILLKLLDAARLQEGLRQQILENADAGSIEVFTKILKFCIEKDMFRYSSAIRAFDTWAGLGYTDGKPAIINKCAKIAYECLTDAAKRDTYLNSSDNLEIYFAIWATGSYEIERTNKMIEQLLCSDLKYKKVLGWYFVSHTDNDDYQMKMAEQYLDERDMELLAWIVSNLAITRELVASYYYVWGYANQGCAIINDSLPKKFKERKELFGKLKDIVLYIGNQNRTFTGNPFFFSGIELNVNRVMDCMLSLAGYDMSEELILEFLAGGLENGKRNSKSSLLSYMSVDQRRAFYNHFLWPNKNQKHIEYMIEALQDRSVSVKELAVKKLSDCKLSENDLLMLADGLRSKSSSLRKNILKVFKGRKPEYVSNVISKLLTSREDYQIQAGIELLLEEKETHPELIENQTDILYMLREKKLSTQTEILFEQLLPSKEDDNVVYSFENGFGLYNPEVVRVSMAEESEEKPKKQSFFGKVFQKTKSYDLYTLDELKKMLILPKEEYFEVYNRMNAVFEKHADYEYTTLEYDGSRATVLFGNANRMNVLIPEEFGNYQTVLKTKSFHMIPFYEEFLEALGEYATNIEKMLCLCYNSESCRSFQNRKTETDKWFAKLGVMEFDTMYHKEGPELFGTRYWQMKNMLELLPKLFDASEVFTISFKIYKSLIAILGEENLGKKFTKPENTPYVHYYLDSGEYLMNHRLLSHFRGVIQDTFRNLSHNGDGEHFKEWFLEECRLEMRANEQMKDSEEVVKLEREHQYLCRIRIFQPLPMADYFRAYDEKLISKDVLYYYLVSGNDAESAIQALTNPRRHLTEKELYEKYSWAKEFVDYAVYRIVEVEQKRGEMPTSLTYVARAIGRFTGAKYFAQLLGALGKDNFFRGYEWSSDNTKRAILSRLLKHCYPAKEDTPEQLAEYLKQMDIKENRLVEAVMYAPQWAGCAEKITGWKGLKCGVWFFHAHINEMFSAEKETEVAIFSPISPHEFNDGAFDRDWFFEAYEKLGEKRFGLLYKSAKYITSGSNQHRRSQLYSDAVLGKLDSASLKEEIIEKRNQEKLRCYPLIPIPEEQTGEALSRYEFIQKFRKESKQFGAQRRESEKKACDTALKNLAITMGIMDVNRMMWYLESEKMEEIRPLMELKEIEAGVFVALAFDENGMAELLVSKNGKLQKTLPKTLNKHEYVLLIKGKIKELKEQKRRAKESLEQAMVEGTEFGLEELIKISTNPVLYPMLKNLVWVEDTKIGFLRQIENGISLLDVSGDENTTDYVEGQKGKIGFRIAHPYDLMQSGKWAAYMRFLYESKLVQPFKQVFREFYPITEDEKQEKNISRRYAGHQVQPQKTIALLRGRGWTVDYEEGLQKVFYKENLIARVYAMADWFSPADIEAPTLETIHFYDRNTGECVDFSDVPPILFSETMRDIDLVVSVAHVGGVDPEASHSTTEMRIAIATELLRLLKITNVTFTEMHAKIKGTLAEYSVHMGSGVVHAGAVGMLAILPVHSQARGRIFLPFADEDPKTAEIMSKIILLAEDKKIKDPSILSQLR